MTGAYDSLFLCPACRVPLPAAGHCSCGFLIHETDGILEFMRPSDDCALQPFIQTYDSIRSDEQWGDDDLDLPFHPKRHRDIWAIRKRTFLAFQSLAAPMASGIALDVGAGNCWMTRYLEKWGFDAVALDVNAGSQDGLRAGDKFLHEGSRFLRVRAPMERLPFASSRIRLVAANAAFHYCDFRTALSEFERVLTPGGRIAIIDTPFYAHTADGERMMAERVLAFQSKYGISEDLARRAGYLTYGAMAQLAHDLNLKIRFRAVWPGMRRKYEQLYAGFTGRRIAQFPLVLLEK